MSKVREGVCSHCQRLVSVRTITLSPQEREELGFDDENPFTRNEPAYITESHDAYGMYCEGSGDIPETVCS